MNILQKFTDNNQYQRFNKSRITTAILTGILLTACGGGGGGGGGSTPTTGTPSTPDNPPSVSVDDRIIVSAGEAVNLTATATDSDGDTISFSWEQQSGETVANTAGFDSSTASFSAPDNVSSMIFNVTATANGQSDQASILVIVVEDVDSAIFIDAEFSGASDGSIDAPYTEFASILEQSLDDDADVDFYIKTPTDGSAYEIWQDADKTINQNISFYGGYQSDWQRDSESNQTPVTTTQNLGLLYSQTDDYVEVSGLSISLTLDDISNSSINRIAAIWGLSATELVVRNNTISIADYPFDNSSAALYGVVSDNVTSFSLVGNSITTGAAPVSARNEVKNNSGSDNGDSGSNGSGDSGGSGGAGGGGGNGGAGGAGGNGFNEDGDTGNIGSTRNNAAAGGGSAGDASASDDDGGNGSSGFRGLTATTGQGANGYGRFTSGGRFAFTTGAHGGDGGDGTGGGGGGGGGSSSLGFNGGGGGGGGEGGEGGAGGFGADSGGASIGVYLVGGTFNDITNNVIVAGNGGMGGIGGLGADGGSGGNGGSGAAGNSNNSGRGGDGGDGGDGADGGIGGSGGGGPSFGILINPNTFASISNNQITTGDGGEGGAAVIATVSSAAGQGGWSIGIFDADTADGLTPDVIENTFTIGEAGSDGNPSDGAGTAAETNF